jgi:hypothetical protein
LLLAIGLSPLAAAMIGNGALAGARPPDPQPPASSPMTGVVQDLQTALVALYDAFEKAQDGDLGGGVVEEIGHHIDGVKELIVDFGFALSAV